MNIIADATIDLLFTKNRVFILLHIFSPTYSAVSINCLQNLGLQFKVVKPIIHCSLQETNAVHVNVGAGSYLEVNIPMTVGEDGN